MNEDEQDVPQRRQRRGAVELRAAILEAASEVFLQEGYQGASIEAVIDRVGGSKRAIYSHFGGKQELFAALVAEASSKVIGAASPGNVEGKDIEDTLRTIGLQLSRVLMAPTTLGLYRAVMAEGPRQPDVARAFFENGPGRVSARLAQLLEQFAARGVISIADGQRAAERFIGMLRDDVHLQAVLGLRAPPGEAEMAESVAQVVRIFIHGIAIQDT